MPSLRQLASQAKAEEKAEQAALKAKLEGIAGQLFLMDRGILILLLDGPQPSYDNEDVIISFTDSGLIEIDYVNDTFSLSRLGKQVAEFIRGLPYHQFINGGEDFVGPKFDENRPLKETAKLIKKEIMDCAKKKKILPDGKYSVKSSRNSIFIELTAKNIQPAQYGSDLNVESIIMCLSYQYNRGQGRGAFDVWQTHIKEE